MSDQPFSTLIAGAGPAGTGLLLYAAQQRKLQQLLNQKIAIIDQSEEIVRGTIGRYRIKSDTSASVFLECLRGELEHLNETAVAKQLTPFGTGPAPLPLVGDLLAQVGKALHQQITPHPHSRIYPRTTIDTIQQCTTEMFRTTCSEQSPNGRIHSKQLYSRSVVLALGGHQDQTAILHAPISPTITLNEPRLRAKVIMTDQLLSLSDGKKAAIISARTTHPSVVIIGGSHSAFASATKLLNLFPRGTFQEQSINILYRRRPKLFYPSAADARADSYTDFGPDDICPITKRVYRLAGMRHESRALLRQIWGMDATNREHRVALTPLTKFDTTPHKLQQLLANTDLLIPAFGYRPRTPTILDPAGKPITLLAHQGGPLVDRHCRVLDADARPIPALFGVGLASGFPITGDLGGEPSFRGQSNGLWLYQNDIAHIILEQIHPSVLS